jgi:PAS domain S-box-containing protein
LAYRHPAERLDQLDCLREVWDACPDALVLSDAAGIILEVNPAYCALSGYPREQLVGHDFTVIFPESERPELRARYQEVFTAPEPDTSFEVTIRRREGSRRIVESRIGFLYTGEDPGAGEARADGPGTPAGTGRARPVALRVPARHRAAMLAVVRDVTEVVRTRAALTAAREREHALMAEANRTLTQVARELGQLGRSLRPGSPAGDRTSRSEHHRR